MKRLILFSLLKSRGHWYIFKLPLYLGRGNGITNDCFHAKDSQDWLPCDLSMICIEWMLKTKTISPSWYISTLTLSAIKGVREETETERGTESLWFLQNTWKTRRVIADLCRVQNTFIFVSTVHKGKIIKNKSSEQTWDNEVWYWGC